MLDKIRLLGVLSLGGLVAACAGEPAREYSNASPSSPLDSMSDGELAEEGVSYACANGQVVTTHFNPLGGDVVLMSGEDRYHLPQGTQEGSTYSYADFANGERITLVMDNADISELTMGEESWGPCIGAWHTVAMEPPVS